MGGVLAFGGSVAFLKTTIAHYSQTPVAEQAILYRSAYTAGSGDLFAPFDHSASVMWIGAVLAIGGTVLRLMSYWRFTRTQEEES